MPRPIRVRKATLAVSSGTSVKQPSAVKAHVTPTKSTKKFVTRKVAQVSATMATEPATCRKTRATSLKSDVSLNKEASESEINCNESAGEEKENKIDRRKPVANAPIIRKLREGARKEVLQVENTVKRSLMGKVMDPQHEGGTLSLAIPRRSPRRKAIVTSPMKETSADRVRKTNTRKTATPKTTIIAKSNASREIDSVKDQIEFPELVVDRQDKGKGRAIELEESTDTEQHTQAASNIEYEYLPSSPPVQGFNQESRDEEEDDSEYGDENSFPEPALQSTPRPKAPSAPLAPQQYEFHNAEHSPTSNQPVCQLFPIAEAGPSSSRNSPSVRSQCQLSPHAKRLWEPSDVSSSSPQQDEPIVTGSTEGDPGPLSFRIYEDPEARSELEHLWVGDASQDARGDGADDNVLRTPKMTSMKRTSSGGAKTPEDGDVLQDDNTVIDDAQNGSDDKEAQQSPPKRQRKVDKSESLYTKDLMNFVAKRRKEKLKPLDILDDMGAIGITSSADDRGSDEDELTKIQRPRVQATSKAKMSPKSIAAKVKKGAATGRVTKTTAKKSTLARATATTKKPSSIPVPLVKIHTSIPEPSIIRRGTGAVSRTYGKKCVENQQEEKFDNTAQSDSLGSIEERSSPHTSEDNNGAIDKEGRRKLREIREKFDEVDVWKLEFEDESPDDIS